MKPTDRPIINHLYFRVTRKNEDASSFSIDLARGRADVYPKQHAKMNGFKHDINGEAWIVVRAKNRVGENAFTTTLTLECKPDGVASAPESDGSGTAG